MTNKKVIYYKKYTDDVVESKNQNYKIKDDYKWIHENICYRICAKIIFAVASAFSFVYYTLIKRIKIENREVLKEYKKQGYFIYGNHTQPVGDAFIPTQVLHKRFYTLASEANLGIPILGKILPMLGALTLPEKTSQMKKMLSAMKTRIKEKATIIIYPEGHVWPYYTKIREFPISAFKFPVDCNAPVFCMTMTYYKKKHRKKPGIRIYVDGPFIPDKTLSSKDKEKELKDKVFNTMKERSKNSNYEYILYKKEE